MKRIGLVWSRVMDRWRKICGDGEAERGTVVGGMVAEQRIVGMDDILVLLSSSPAFVFRLCLTSLNRSYLEGAIGM